MNYKFINPGKIKVNNRVSEDIGYVDLSGTVWYWKDAGIIFKLDWSKFTLHKQLIEIFKGFICHRLKTRSLLSTYKNSRFMIRHIDQINKDKYPLNLKEIKIIGEYLITKDLKYYFGFISFYKWCIAQNIENFSEENLAFIRQLKYSVRTPYKNALLYPNYLTPSDELRITQFINENYKSDRVSILRNTIILNISLELGLRPIQIFSINKNDLNVIESSDKLVKYYSLNIQMAKKLSNTSYEKRNRSISAMLGKQIIRLIDLLGKYETASIEGLFIKRKGNDFFFRLSTKDISEIIVYQLGKLGFQKGDGATLLRHHLAQSLADQGTPADIIAEILGHNSTVPARAYISATPEIAAIKTKALGKSEVYSNIMKMLLTGEIIEKTGTNKKQWVKGMIGSQYIGGIGSCGLAENTSCPKNPVYSCYTCNKFHPFIDGNHEEVKTNLQQQAQFNVDIANASMDLQYNRPSTQLETTIIAVNTVIEKCNSLLPKIKV
jgi:integrase